MSIHRDVQGPDTFLAKRKKMSKARLMRLGLLMAITMTLHNLPEGFAVAFSSYTSVGPVMAAAIGVHNVPEGIIVAAPVFAATGSRRKGTYAYWGFPKSRHTVYWPSLSALRP